MIFMDREELSSLGRVTKSHEMKRLNYADVLSKFYFIMYDVAVFETTLRNSLL